jgi:photosystem II stability/assembly factor-like uncharacterized protein
VTTLGLLLLAGAACVAPVRTGDRPQPLPVVASARWVPQASGTTARFRAVSAVSATVVWASGNNDTFARTVDGGATWTSAIVPGAESLDFRDVEAFDEYTAYLLSIGPGDRSRIYKTMDGGRHWALQFKNLDSGAFFDAMAFWDAQSGIVIGDPVDGRMVVVRTFDGGETWIDIPRANMPPALAGEAAFAASGTCVTAQGRDHVWVGTGGGPEARVFRSADRGFTWHVATTPIAAGTVSSGIFSVAFTDALHGFVVGGDYKKEGEPSENLAATSDGGQTWTMIGSTRLRGFRSAVAVVPGAAGPVVVAVGPAGSDVSFDEGKTWTNLDLAGCHALSLAGAIEAGWAVGEGGRIAKLVGPLRGWR